MVQQDFSLDKTLLSLYQLRKKAFGRLHNSPSRCQLQLRKNLLHVLCPKPKLDPGTKVGHLHCPAQGQISSTQFLGSFERWLRSRY